jgi:hypothetical protein
MPKAVFSDEQDAISGYELTHLGIAIHQLP